MAPKTSPQDWTKSPCHGCSACCRSTVVNLTHTDLFRLVHSLQDRVFDFLKLYKYSDYDGEPDDPDLARTRYGWRMLGLRRSEAKGCIFLGPAGDCRIYADRPGICRTFPYEKPSPKSRAISLSVLVQDKDIDCALSRHPSSKAAVNRTDIDEDDSMRKEFQALLRQWNTMTMAKRNRTMPALVNYLLQHVSPTR